uniref:Uncharacterized protein n=1 Tax=Peronospora matthiolae TaxID=2874970 RepID=A0AAV1UA12_9STRA
MQIPNTCCVQSELILADLLTKAIDQHEVEKLRSLAGLH